MEKSVYRRGICPICNAEEVMGHHYLYSHGVRMREHFQPTRRRGVPNNRYQLYCKVHHDVLVDGSHEAMAHLVEQHPEILSSQPDNGPEMAGNEDHAYTPSDVTVAGVFRILVYERNAAEDEVVRLQAYIETLEERLKDAQKRPLQFEGMKEENRRLHEENERLAADNRGMNEKLQRTVHGAISLAELKAIRDGQ